MLYLLKIFCEELFSEFDSGGWVGELVERTARQGGQGGLDRLVLPVTVKLLCFKPVLDEHS